MTATPAELLRELDAKATKGPWSPAYDAARDALVRAMEEGR